MWLIVAASLSVLLMVFPGGVVAAGWHMHGYPRRVYVHPTTIAAVIGLGLAPFALVLLGRPAAWYVWGAIAVCLAVGLACWRSPATSRAAYGYALGAGGATVLIAWRVPEAGPLILALLGATIGRTLALLRLPLMRWPVAADPRRRAHLAVEARRLPWWLQAARVLFIGAAGYVVYRTAGQGMLPPLAALAAFNISEALIAMAGFVPTGSARDTPWLRDERRRRSVTDSGVLGVGLGLAIASSLIGAPLMIVFLVLIAIVVFQAIMSLRHRATWRPLVLERQGLVCPACLHALTADVERCPECAYACTAETARTAWARTLRSWETRHWPTATQTSPAPAPE